jgi:hypothetical protein
LIIGAIFEGERETKKLAQLRDERCHHSGEQLALSWEGTWRPEHLFELRPAHEKSKMLKALERKAAALGFQLSPRPTQ